MVIQFLKAATVEGKRYTQGQIVEVDNDTAHKLIASGIAKEREGGPGDVEYDDDAPDSDGGE